MRRATTNTRRLLRWVAHVMKIAQVNAHLAVIVFEVALQESAFGPGFE
jgi:hypothetical protein